MLPAARYRDRGQQSTQVAVHALRAGVSAALVLRCGWRYGLRVGENCAKTGRDMSYRCVLCCADLRNPTGFVPPSQACDSCAELYRRILRDRAASKKMNFQRFSGKTNNLKSSAEYPLINQPKNVILPSVERNTNTKHKGHENVYDH